MSDLTIQTNLDKVSKIFYQMANQYSDLKDMFDAGVKFWRYGYDNTTDNKTFKTDIKGNWKKSFADDIWATEGQQISGKWTRLSDKWIKRRLPKPMLEQSGRLRKAVKLISGDSVVETTKNTVKMGIVNIPYARVHQWGYKAIPQRAYFVTKEDQIPFRLIGFYMEFLRGKARYTENQIEKLPKGVL